MTCLLDLVSSRETEHSARHLNYAVTFFCVNDFSNVIDLSAETGEELNVLGGGDSKGQDADWRQSSWPWRICTVSAWPGSGKTGSAHVPLTFIWREYDLWDL